MGFKDVDPREVRILADGFECNNRFHPYEDITHLSFAKQIVASSVNAIPTNKEFDAQLVLHLKSDPSEIRVRTNKYKAFHLFRKRVDTSELFSEIDELYEALAATTFQQRLQSYTSELEARGFFTYSQVRFYSDGRISSKSRTMHLSDVAFRRDEDLPARLNIEQVSRKKGLRDYLIGAPSIPIDIETDFDCLKNLLEQIGA